MTIKNTGHDEELKKSLQKNRDLFENAVVGMYRTSIDGSEILEVNQALCNMFGSTRREILSSADTIRWADPKAREEMVNQLNKYGTVTNYSIDFINKRGEIKHCLVSAKLYQQEGYVDGTLIDITERKRVEDELYLFKKLVEHSSDAIGMSTPEGRHYYQNEAFDHMFGDIGDSPPETVYVDKAIGKQVFEIIIAGGNWQGEVKMFKKDRTILDIFLRAYAIQDQDGRTIGLVGLHTDITMRKQAENAFREKDMQYRQLIEQAADGIFVIDASGEFLLANSKFCELLGYAEDELSHINILNTYPDESIGVGQQRLKLLQSGESLRFERPMKRKDGSLFIAEASAMKLHDGSLQAIVHDITERKQTEEAKVKLEYQNRQLQKAESLSRMAGAIAHHFNNQLQTVIGNLELALGNWGEDPVERMTIAMNAASKATEVSRLMLIYLGETTGKREPLDLSRACRRSLPLLRASMPKYVVLKADLPSPGPIINANENQIQQVLTNLVTNAWEAIGKTEGSIKLKVNTVSPEKVPATHRFPIGWQPQDLVYTCLEVTDTGCGTEDKDIDKLFDPFFSSKFTGRGMGLPIVLGIVKAHQGAVTVESEPALGSTFRVFLPVSDVEVIQQPDNVVTSSEIEGGGTVLLVEDDELVRNITTTMLTRLGFMVIEAHDGIEAVEVFQQHKDQIRFVLCDMTMPRMNGWKTLSALRELTPNIPVILASGYNEAQVMASGHAELPQAFLEKPYKFKTLKDAISKALGDRKE